jgi:hypothetical protein
MYMDKINADLTDRQIQHGRYPRYQYRQAVSTPTKQIGNTNGV